MKINQKVLERGVINFIREGGIVGLCESDLQEIIEDVEDILYMNEISVNDNVVKAFCISLLNPPEIIKDSIQYYSRRGKYSDEPIRSNKKKFKDIMEDDVLYEFKSLDGLLCNFLEKVEEGFDESLDLTRDDLLTIIYKIHENDLKRERLLESPISIRSRLSYI